MFGGDADAGIADADLDCALVCALAVQIAQDLLCQLGADGGNVAVDEADVFTTWLMMPQPISTKQVSITYLINNRQFVSVFPLYTDSLTEWAENQYIKYTITLSPYKISFVPDVKDWAPVDGNNVEMEN